MSALLGGTASPIGWSVQYVDAPFDEVVPALVAWRRGLEQQLEVSDPGPYPSCLQALMPFQAPWTRELLLPCGTWTAYLNNMIGGGDLSAAGGAVAKNLGVRWVGARHTPQRGPGHQSTQLRVRGGAPSSSPERSVAVFEQDGRWGWETFGDPLPFEDLSRYQARRKRDRFDRDLLLVYLRALGIPAAEDDAYGPGTLVQQRAGWHDERPPRIVTLAQARGDLAKTPDDR